MSTSNPIEYYLKRYPGISTLVYVGFVVALLLTTVFALVGTLERYQGVSASTEILAQLRQHGRSLQPLSQEADFVSNGSPFLEGQSVTMASAALLQQISRAVTRAGGSIVSTEVEQQGETTTDAFVRASVTCELEQTALQPLLYDIEAGMPFLFINRLVAQAPSPTGESGRMHVVLAVSGLWWEAK